jgi:hypothetical protein
VTKGDFTVTANEKPWSTVQVVARAEGFGLGWADGFDDNDVKVDTRNLTIRLSLDTVPIMGRILDLEGRPVPDATIRVEEILEPKKGDLSAWIAASTTGKGGAQELEPAFFTRRLWAGGSGLPTKIAINKDARFMLMGIGRERLIRLNISGPTIQTKSIAVLTRRDVMPFQVNYARGTPDWGIARYFGARFVHPAAPTKPVAGVVKDKDSGKPLAGVRISCYATSEYRVSDLTILNSSYKLETTTDLDGRYRLVGLPKGRGNRVLVLAAKGQPYLDSMVDIPDSPGLDPVALDIGLKRGVAIEGRVTDKWTGDPLSAYVEYSAFRDNPNLAEAPGYAEARVQGRYQTEPDGSFRVVGLPGRGVVSAIYIGGGNRYLSDVELPGDFAASFSPDSVVPNSSFGVANAISLVDLPKDVLTVRRDLALEPGVMRNVRVVDPEGRPLAGARIQGLYHFGGWSRPQKTAELRLEGLQPKEARRLMAVHGGHKLAGMVTVRADQEGIVDLKLQPWATVVGRLTDEDGQARAKVDVVLSARSREPVTTDSQGRFRLEGLTPGKAATILVRKDEISSSGIIAKDLVLGSGELKDLGEVHEKRP